MSFANPSRILLATVAIAVAAIPFTGQADECPPGVGTECGAPECYNQVSGYTVDACCKFEPSPEDPCEFYCKAACSTISDNYPACTSIPCGGCVNGKCSGEAHIMGESGNYIEAGGLVCREWTWITTCTFKPCVPSEQTPGCPPQLPPCVPSQYASESIGVPKFVSTEGQCIPT
jgi:hypothetical protein